MGCSGTVTSPTDARLHDLETAGALTPAPRPRLDALTGLAARLAGVPAVAVDVASAQGWATLSGPAQDQRPGMHVVAELPLVSDGAQVGVLRVLDGSPRELDEGVVQDLSVLADGVVGALESEALAHQAFEAREGAARSQEQLTQVLGKVAHDLNNPLAAVAMSLEIARDQVDEGSQALLASLLDRAGSSALRMKRMTSDLLSYAQDPVAGLTDLQAEVERTLGDLEDVLAGQVRVSGALPTVVGDPGALRVVLVSLIENARKFTHDGVEPQVEISAEDLGGQWRISVLDNARGIPAEECERIFDPMVRLDKKVPGLGLGLSTALRIVTAAGGRMGAAPRPGGGSEIWFTLPAAGRPAGSVIVAD